MTILDDYLKLVEREATANKKVKDVKAEFDRQVSDKYKVLSEEEIKVLVVEDKWMNRLENSVNSELERISQISGMATRKAFLNALASGHSGF